MAGFERAHCHYGRDKAPLEDRILAGAYDVWRNSNKNVQTQNDTDVDRQTDYRDTDYRGKPYLHREYRKGENQLQEPL